MFLVKLIVRIDPKPMSWLLDQLPYDQPSGGATIRVSTKVKNLLVAKKVFVTRARLLVKFY